MLNCVYRLKAPRVFEPVQIEVPSDGSRVIVRPTYLSICNADQRYYRGMRSEDVLFRKLPMALIHEGIGIVVEDSSGVFNKGEKVVMLPNEALETDPCVSENYLKTSKFSGSGYDGFMQEYLSLPHDRLLKLPQGINDKVAAFTELVSVGVHAVQRMEKLSHCRKDVFGVWGDGNVGFIVALLLRVRYPDSKIVVFGRHDYKLDGFTFVDEVCLSGGSYDNDSIDHAFECCGGSGSALAIDEIIPRIRPEGTIALMGVSENSIPVDTRLLLEKGLRVIGNSRSSFEDFSRTIAIYEESPWVLDYLASLVSQVIEVKSILDIVEAFETDMRKSMGKTIMKWKM